MRDSQAIPLSSTARIVTVSFLALCIIFGIRLSFSVFFAEFTLAEGWSNQGAAAIFSLNMLVFGLTAPLAGTALDRWGPRPVFGLGAALMALGLWLSSQAQSLPDLLLAYGIIGGVGLGITGLGPVASIVAGWASPARRGRAIGIAFAGTGLGSLLFVPLADLLIAQVAWRSAYLILALICLLALAPLMMIGMKRPPGPHAGAPSAMPAPRPWALLLRDPAFWALMLLGLTALGPLRSLTVHQIAFMESVGVERPLAAAVVGLAGFLTTFAYIGLGWVSDRRGRVAAYGIGSVGLMGAVVMLFAFRAGGAISLVYVYALLFALGEGTRSSQTTALASDVFQRQGLGRINGLVGGTFGLGAALGPWLVGVIRDRSDAYDGGLALVLLMTLVSLCAFIFVARSRRQEPIQQPTSPGAAG